MKRPDRTFHNVRSLRSVDWRFWKKQRLSIKGIFKVLKRWDVQISKALEFRDVQSWIGRGQNNPRNNSAHFVFFSNFSNIDHTVLTNADYYRLLSYVPAITRMCFIFSAVWWKFWARPLHSQTPVLVFFFANAFSFLASKRRKTKWFDGTSFWSKFLDYFFKYLVHINNIESFNLHPTDPLEQLQNASHGVFWTTYKFADLLFLRFEIEKQPVGQSLQDWSGNRVLARLWGVNFRT